MPSKKIYIAIDLKSFYASVECVERGLNPLTTNLVVADETRTEKTICLAVTPSLKKYGIPGRARLFEVVQKIRETNSKRRLDAVNHKLVKKSYDSTQLEKNPNLAIDYIVASPRMSKYMEISNKIYSIYLKYVSEQDIHNYSVDEVFIDATSYLRLYNLTPRAFAIKLINEVLQNTGITATAGIGTNLYLCKVAMDIVAKHMPADKNGVRIAELDEISYKKTLWNHRPLTDFWRVGKGYANKLEAYGLYTMGDIVKCSLGKLHEYYNEDLLYKLFGVNAELLIDHAWGYEPCTMKEIKSYKSSTNSLGSGQVLSEPYSYEKGLLVTREMMDLLSLELVDKNLLTNQLVLTVMYDVENLTKRTQKYAGAVTDDRYGRLMPKPAHGTINLPCYTSSTKELLSAISALYQRIVSKSLLVRKIYITAARVLLSDEVENTREYEQSDLFANHAKLEEDKKIKEEQLARESHVQNAVLDIKRKFGKNSIVKGMNLKKGGTAMSRNKQVGGHKA